MSNEFKYTREWTDEGAFPLLGFTKNWENPSDYPTYEPDETQVRKDMQSLHDEVKNFLNNELIPRVVAEDATVEAWTYAEEQRAANEVTRVANEEQRVANEAARVAAESGRTAAEQARALAEQGRVDSTTGIVAQATEQARAASSSAVYAADSASAASASAAEATQQAGIAFTWASHAEQVANHAAAAANGADDSRIRAEESAGQAAASASSAARSESEAKRYAEQASSASSGDMLQSVYDPTGKRQDVFKYVDDGLVTKAPAGYGLGSSKAFGISDCNSAMKAGWYYTGGATTNGPVVNGVAQQYLSLLVSVRNADTADQIAFGHYQGNHLIWRRYTIDSGATWSGWVRLDDYAPAGYGLGTGGAMCSDCNEAVNSGWYTCAEAANTPGITPYGWMLVSSRSGAGGMIRQEYYSSLGDPIHWVRYCVTGTWGEWRCVDTIYGTADLTAGSSPLANGQLYFVYE